MLVDLALLEREYCERKPDVEDPNQLVSFGTSGHRGSPFRGSFTEAHVAAITQAICDHRRAQRIDGPLYMGKDTHALSQQKWTTCSPEQSWLCKLETTKTGRRFSSPVCASSWSFCHWTSPSASNNAKQRWRFAERAL